jgi:hypothetical protein
MPLQVQLPALQLPLLTALDCRCCGTFPSNVSSLPQLQTLGISAPFPAAAWHVAVDHSPETSAVGAADAAAVSATAAVSSPLITDAAAMVGTPAAADEYQTPALSAAVLQMLQNDIATPTRGQTWKVYCKKS